MDQSVKLENLPEKRIVPLESSLISRKVVIIPLESPIVSKRRIVIVPSESSLVPEKKIVPSGGSPEKRIASSETFLGENINLTEEFIKSRDKEKAKKKKDIKVQIVPSTENSRGVIYIRVSTLKQVGPDHISVETQEGFCRRWADEHKIKLYENGIIPGVVNGVMSDLGKSGTSMKDRSIFLLTSFLKPGDHIMVYDVSRLVRDTITATIIEDMFEKKGIYLDSVTQPSSSIIPGTEKTPESNFLRTIMHAMDEFEAVKTSVNVKRALAEKKLRGEAVGRIPFGKMINPETKKVIDDPEDVKIIREIYIMRSIKIPYITSKNILHQRKLTFREITDRLNSLMARCPGDKIKKESRIGWMEETVRVTYNKFRDSLPREPMFDLSEIQKRIDSLQELFNLSYNICKDIVDMTFFNYPWETILSNIKVKYQLDIDAVLASGNMSFENVNNISFAFILMKYKETLQEEIFSFTERCKLAEDDPETIQKKVLMKFGRSIE